MNESGRKRQRRDIEIRSVSGHHGATIGVKDGDGPCGDVFVRNRERRGAKMCSASRVGNDDVVFGGGMTRASNYRGR
jgi:hypothetical protein